MGDDSLIHVNSNMKLPSTTLPRRSGWRDLFLLGFQRWRMRYLTTNSLWLKISLPKPTAFLDIISLQISHKQIEQLINVKYNVKKYIILSSTQRNIFQIPPSFFSPPIVATDDSHASCEANWDGFTKMDTMASHPKDELLAVLEVDFPHEVYLKSFMKNSVPVSQYIIWGWNLKWWVSPTTMGKLLLKMISTWGVKWGYHHLRIHHDPPMCGLHTKNMYGYESLIVGWSLSQ